VKTERGDGVTGEIKRLLELQDKDQECAALAAQIKHLNEQRSRLKQKREEEIARVEEMRRALEELERESRQRNLEVDDLDMQIHAYQKQLDEGIISFKEMEALREKIASQKKRMSEMEDEALMLMDRIVEEKENLIRAEKDLEVRLSELDDEEEKLAAHISDVKTALSATETARKEIAGQLSPSLLARYENLRRNFPDPVVPIKNGICTGCNLRVSGHTVERARNTAEIVTCENCSRILYIR